MIRVCFVCMGNICRSPTAEGVFIHLVRAAGIEEHFVIDSAGTGGWHGGEPADRRSFETARRRGVHLPSRARQFQRPDFELFDYVVAMDRDNLEHLQSLTRAPEQLAKLSLLRAWAGDDGDQLDVPDPYYGGPGGFEEVFDICQRGCEHLLRELRARHQL